MTEGQADDSVQDHLLHSKNGEEKPNHRDNYLHGNSLPIKQEEIVVTVEKLITDLSKRAGGGPTCRCPDPFYPRQYLMSSHGPSLAQGQISRRTREIYPTRSLLS